MRASRHLLLPGLLAFASFALAKLGLLFIDHSTGIAILWPASALAFIALVKSDRARWPQLLVGLSVGNAAAEIGASAHLPVAAAFVVANAVEPVVAALAFHVVAQRDRFVLDTPRAVVGLLAAIVSAGAGALIAATAAAIVLDAPFVEACGRWWLSDGVAIAATAPLGLVMLKQERRSAPPVESVLIAAATVLATAVVFWRGGHHHTPLGSYPFVLLPVLLWGALRGSPRFVAGQLAALVALTLAGTLTGHGPFARADITIAHRITALQLFLVTSTLSTLLVSTVTMQLHRVTERLRTERRRVGAVLEHHQLVVQHLPGVLVSLYDRDLRCEMLEGGAVAGSPYEDESTWRGRHLTELLPTVDSDRLVPYFRAALSGKEGRFDWLSPATDRLFEMHVMPAPSPTGEVDHVVCLAWDVTAARAHEHELQVLAERDPLTGASNRRHLGVVIGRHLAACEAVGREGGALLVLDLDDFKPVNDQFGHGVGDELLQAVVHAVRRELRPEDTLARTGGDEFAVLLPRADRQAARRVQECLTRVVDELRIPVEGGSTAQAGVSVGLAMHGDLPNPTIESWLDAADSAMYLRKRTTYAQRSIAS